MQCANQANGCIIENSTIFNFKIITMCVFLREATRGGDHKTAKVLIRTATFILQVITQIFPSHPGRARSVTQ